MKNGKERYRKSMIDSFHYFEPHDDLRMLLFFSSAGHMTKEYQLLCEEGLAIIKEIFPSEYFIKGYERAFCEAALKHHKN